MEERQNASITKQKVYALIFIEKYCLEGEINHQKFLEFAKDYTYFSPYFDFVVGVLNYSLINPWLQKNTLLCHLSNTRSYKRKKYAANMDMYVPYGYRKAKIGFSSDKDLQIKGFEQTENGMEIIPNIDGHRELAKQLLNLGMIKDKELCERIV